MSSRPTVGVDLRDRLGRALHGRARQPRSRGTALPSIRADLGGGCWRSSGRSTRNAHVRRCCLLDGRRARRSSVAARFVIGLGLFTLASALAALAPSTGAPIAARALAGRGARSSRRSTLTLVTRPGEQARRSRSARWSGSSAARRRLGPLVGGAVVDGIAGTGSSGQRADRVDRPRRADRAGRSAAGPAAGLDRPEIEHPCRAARLRPIVPRVDAVGHDAIPSAVRLFAGAARRRSAVRAESPDRAALPLSSSPRCRRSSTTVTAAVHATAATLIFHRSPARPSASATKHGLPPRRPSRARSRTSRADAVPPSARSAKPSTRRSSTASSPRRVSRPQGPGRGRLKDLAPHHRATPVSRPRTPLPRGAGRHSSIPPPLNGARARPHVADFFWPDHRLVVETDGLEHRTC